MKYIVCFSGGHSSAISAIETVRKVGKENTILLTHHISQNVEDPDVERFRHEVAKYLGMEITSCDMPDWDVKDPLDICMDIKAFKVGNGTCLCTNRLKTQPFHKWLKGNYPSKPNNPREDIVIVYGFDKSETNRIERRRKIMLAMGYNIACPLAEWNRTIQKTEDIGIQRPSTYDRFRHANCMGCLKAGKQQWYITYCLRPDLWEKAKSAEEKIGYSILKKAYLKDLEEQFKKMKEIGVEPTEKINSATFWAMVRRMLK